MNHKSVEKLNLSQKPFQIKSDSTVNLQTQSGKTLIKTVKSAGALSPHKNKILLVSSEFGKKIQFKIAQVYAEHLPSKDRRDWECT